MNKNLIAGFIGLAILSGLSTAYAQQETAPKVNPTYRATATKINDLVHTKLDVKFDYAKRYLYGKAWITLKPHFYTTDTLTLDAKGMDLKTVALVGAKSNTPLKFTYDQEKIYIQLNKRYVKDEKYTVYIDYVSKPNELKASGSAAITDEKGLYFINPDGTDKEKPIQIWTQGEAESSSAWFPTIDKPNQKTTSELSMTVLSKYVTLSNGKLVSQKVNTNGTRTDTWKMDLPHSPYLFMMAVGDFKITKELWRGKEVSYYLEQKYAPYAKAIFGKTPKMLDYFSQITGVAYPWNKYAQIVARDYVSGAMENTTATLHGESIQATERELLDGSGESTIAHELFHQWFGDYVTTESWSNITVNESFATLGAILWKGHDAGKDAEDRNRYESLNSYLGTTENGESPMLVRFNYNNKMDVFDQVSYPKGAVILYALKNQMGDDAFYKSLNRYLTTNAFKNGEAQQLRLAFEDVTGKDWSQYFNQWYYAGGHPILDVKYDYKDGNATINIKQTQAADVQTFTLTLKVDIYIGGKKISKEIVINSREQNFSFPVSAKPDLIDFDVDKILVGELKETKTLENYIFQYSNAPSYVNRIHAVEYAVSKSKESAAQQLLTLALKDQDDAIRALAIKGFNLKDEKVKASVGPILVSLAKQDKSSNVRAAALSRLAASGDKIYLPVAQAALKDRSYKVIGAAVQSINKLDPSMLSGVIAGLDADTKAHIPSDLALVYAALGDDSYNDFYLNIINKADINKLAQTVGGYYTYLLANKNPKITQSGLQAIITNMDRTKLTQYWGKQFVKNFTDAEQAKLKEAETATGEAKDNLIKRAAYFKAAADELAKK
ncbi:M1 family peptidase [Pedobacter frigiditerrae]|uniref:Aminopeptidase N n=1 Tax=Pedobacter frigiditerrae TaxID=2530452 RepID=A0A4R0N5U9_9SPHI|nr:M1 family metallopeptidase [Pedobacter frigiditerrae]TCC93992.1 M1 family peptidase [Pedobacter frigiditerrae]